MPFSGAENVQVSGVENVQVSGAENVQLKRHQSGVSDVIQVRFNSGSGAIQDLSRSCSEAA